MRKGSRLETRRWHASTSRATSSIRRGTTPSLHARHNIPHEALICACVLNSTCTRPQRSPAASVVYSTVVCWSVRCASKPPRQIGGSKRCGNGTLCLGRRYPSPFRAPPHVQQIAGRNLRARREQPQQRLVVRSGARVTGPHVARDCPGQRTAV